MISMIPGFGLDRIRSKLGFHLLNDNPVFGPFCWDDLLVGLSDIATPRASLTLAQAAPVGVSAVTAARTPISVSRSRLAPLAAAVVGRTAAVVPTTPLSIVYSDSDIPTDDMRDCT